MSNSHTCIICNLPINTEIDKYTGKAKQSYQAFTKGMSSGLVHDSCVQFIDDGLKPSSMGASQTRKAVDKDAFDSAMEEFNALSLDEQANLYQSFVVSSQEQDYSQRLQDYNPTVSKAGNLPTSLPTCQLCHAPIFPDEKSVVLDNRRGGTDVMHESCLAEKLSVGLNGVQGSFSKQRAAAANRLRGNK